MYLITDKANGRQYSDSYHAPKENIEGLSRLCIDAGLANTLVYTDIECLLTDGETWYMLDECGNWAYLPERYKVKVV